MTDKTALSLYPFRLSSVTKSPIWGGTAVGAGVG